jgi:hypothetical protein
MKKLSEFIERHEIDRPMFFTLLALCVLIFIFVIYQLFTVFGWWAFSPIVVSIIWIVASILKAKPKEEPAGKKWVAIAPEKGEIAPYLTNGKAYDVIRFDSYSDGELIISKIYGRAFDIIADDGSLIEPNEFESTFLKGLNWKLKEVSISKNEPKDSKNQPIK